MLKVFKTRDVKTPERSGRNAGFDFFIPNDIDHDPVLGGFYINPQSHQSIPSGIKVNVPEGYALVAFNKSGIATKKGLQVGACVVDCGYQGEVHIHLTNVGL